MAKNNKTTTNKAGPKTRAQLKKQEERKKLEFKDIGYTQKMKEAHQVKIQKRRGGRHYKT